MAKTSHFQEFRCNFCQKFSWTSVKTLVIETVGPHGQNVPFSRSNGPGSDLSYGSSRPSRPKRPIYKVKRAPYQPSWPKHPIFKDKRAPEQDLSYGASGLSRTKYPIFMVKPVPKRIATSFLPKFFVDVREDLSYGASWPTRPKRPLYKSMDFLVIWNFELWSQLTLTAKTSHFQGQTKPRADLSYGASWPSQPKCPIFEVKQAPDQPWSQLALTAKTSHFQGQTDPESDLSNGASCSSQPKRPILKVKRAPEQPKCFIDVREELSYGLNLPFWSSKRGEIIFCQNFVDVVKTFAKLIASHGQNVPFEDLSYGLIGPHGQNIPFSRSNERLEDLNYGARWLSWPTRPIFKVKRTPDQPKRPIFKVKLTAEQVKRATKGTKYALWTSLRPLVDPLPPTKASIFKVKANPEKTLAMEQLTLNQNIPFSRSSEPRAQRWPSWQKHPIFKVKGTPNQVKRKPHFANLCAIVHGLLDLKFHCQNFVHHEDLIYGIDRTIFQGQSSWEGILVMDPVGPHGQNVPFSRSNRTRIRNTLAMDSVSPHGQNIPFSRPNVPESSKLSLTAKTSYFQGQTAPGSDLRYGASWPSRPKSPIFKLWIQLALSAKKSHFESQMSPRTDLCYGANCPSWPKCSIFKVKQAPDQLALTAKTSHFQGETSPEKGKPPILPIFPKRPIFKVKLTPEQPKHPIFNVKRTLEQTLAMEPSWPSWPKRPIFKVKLTSDQFSVDVREALAMDSVSPHGRNDPFSCSNRPRISWPSRPKHPIFKVKRPPDKSMDFLVIWNSNLIFAKFFLWMSVKILAMELVGPHGQRVPFSRLNDPRISSKIPSSFLPKFLVDVHEDLRYGGSCPSRPKHPILKVKQALEQLPLMEKCPIFKVKRAADQLALMAKTSHFKGQTILEQLWSQLAFTAKTSHFKGQTGPELDFRYGASCSLWPKRPIFKVKRPLDKLWSKLALTAKISHFEGQTSTRADLSYGASWLSRPKRPIFKVKRDPNQTLDMEPVVSHGQNDPFSRSNGLQISYGASWPSQLKYPILKVKRALEKTLVMEPVRPYGQQIPFSRSNGLGSVHGLFGYLEFRVHFCQIFLWTSMKTLAVYSVSPHNQNLPFSRSNKPRIRYGDSCPSRPERPIFKVRRTQDQNFELIFAKIICGRMLRPYLWSQLTLTTKTSYFHSQTNPGADLSYGSSRPSWPKRSIFKVKRPPDKTLAYGASWSSRPIRPIFKDLNYEASWPSWLKQPIYKVKRALDQLTLAAKTSHFQGLTNPGEDLSYKDSWSSRPKRSIFKVKQPPDQLKHPIFKVKRGPDQVNATVCQFSCSIVHGLYGDLEFQAHFCQNLSLTSVKTLAMDSVGPHHKKVPFSRCNEHQISYGTSRPSRPIRPIFIVKRIPDQTLAMDSISPHSQNIPFSRSDEPWSSYGASCLSRPKRPIIKVKRDSDQTLDMKPVGPHGKNIPFSRSNGLRISWPSRPKRPILMVKQAPEQLALMANTSHYQGEMDPRSDLSYGVSWPSRPKYPILRVKRVPEQLDLTANTSHFQGQTFPGSAKHPISQFSFAIVHELFGDLEFRAYFCQNISWTSVKNLAIEPVGPHGQHIPFSRSNGISKNPWTFGDPEFELNFLWTSVKTFITPILSWDRDLSYRFSQPSRPKPPIFKVKQASDQLALTANTSHFQGQTGPESDVREDLSYGFSELSLPKRPILKLNRPRIRILGDQEFRAHFCLNFSWTFVKTLAMELVGPHRQHIPFSRSNSSRISSFLPKIFVDVREELSYGFIYSSWPKHPILKVERTLEKFKNFLAIWNFDIIFAKVLRGPTWPSRPKPPNFKVKRPPDKETLHFADFRVLESMDFLVIWNFDLTFTKNFHGYPLRP
ncbi:hypothetical protein H5410_029294 [Solanum commersonii]|uniref:Uncharacterized protein n=1 Tax=Solanum commersonii TaxID=4109 RepID=A0A9J5Z575_SOLCO|nr:hypothetical protein H5410_029294 [Solanum commersonii]